MWAPCCAAPAPKLNGQGALYILYSNAGMPLNGRPPARWGPRQRGAVHGNNSELSRPMLHTVYVHLY